MKDKFFDWLETISLATLMFATLSISGLILILSALLYAVIAVNVYDEIIYQQTAVPQSEIEPLVVELPGGNVITAHCAMLTVTMPDQSRLYFEVDAETPVRWEFDRPGFNRFLRTHSTEGMVLAAGERCLQITDTLSQA